MTYGEVDVIFDFQPGGYPSHGYTEYRIVVANKGSDRTRRVRLEFPGTSFAGPGSGGIRGISRTVDVGPGQATTVSLLQPAMPQVIGSGLTVYIDGRKQDDQMSLNPVAGHGGMVAYGRGRHYARSPSRGITGDSLVLTSQRVGENFIKVPGLAVAGMPGTGGLMPPPIVPGGGAVKMAPGGIAAPAIQAIQGQFLRAEVPISGWSDRWLAY